MQKIKPNIKENIMEKIQNDEIKIKPRSYFIIGSLISLLGLIASVITSIFLISIISFMLRQHGPMGGYRLSLMIESFPIWIPILAIIGIITGVFILRKYDFSYKSNFWLILAGFLFSIIIAGFLIDLAGLNNLWLKKGPMNQIMKNYNQNDNDSKNDINGHGKGNGGYRLRNNFE